MAVSVGTAASWLVAWGRERDLIGCEDETWAYNRILEEVGAYGPGRVPVALADLDLDAALAALAEQAVVAGVVEDSAAGRDRAAMRSAACILPRPSEIAARFDALMKEAGPEAATRWFYGASCDVNYVRRSAIARNLLWVTPTRWGELEISINKSKPEKDPKDIAAALAAPPRPTYPACQLCMENEGYGGRPAASGEHPARQNLRIVPITLGGERWGLQYSPYAYYLEHCIAMSAEHRPMRVDGAAIGRLLDFLELFPHYFVGSNADLPIVGGSILTHDHFQGGHHVFPMELADELEPFAMAEHPGVFACVLRWPLSVIRLRSADRQALLAAATHVIGAWRVWDAPEVGVVARDDAGPHNTVTPIARMREGAFELDLALRCNVTTPEHPLGLFHPHEDKWHVKKENIGLIEVMGLAILPPRLEVELEAGRLTEDEIGQVFAGVLEDAGVFKWDEAGRAAQARFVESL